MISKSHYCASAILILSPAFEAGPESLTIMYAAHSRKPRQRQAAADLTNGGQRKYHQAVRAVEDEEPEEDEAGESGSWQHQLWRRSSPLRSRRRHSRSHSYSQEAGHSNDADPNSIQQQVSRASNTAVFAGAARPLTLHQWDDRPSQWFETDAPDDWDLGSEWELAMEEIATQVDEYGRFKECITVAVSDDED
ncbi:hypothetical protein BKA56DRAFT_620800 [Ilyonectria sp. MPI-CAGE-AT-0026]|nr:hypothetical protein BKA56DRAFT_620800 [Ilyonectria sp. MPI-CAGE-AT-0026]